MKKQINTPEWQWGSSVISKLKGKFSRNARNSEVEPTYWSPQLGRLLAIGINAGALIRSHPLYCDLETNEIKLRNGRKDMLLWGLNIAFDVMYFAFVAYQTFSGRSLEGRRNLFMNFCTILLLLPLTYQVWLLKYAAESLPCATMQALRFAKEFHKQVRPVVGSGGKVLEIRIAEYFFAFLFVNCQLVVCFFTLLSIFRPNLRIFLTSVQLPGFQTLQYVISIVAVAHYAQNYVTLLYIATFPGSFAMFEIIAAINGMLHSSAMESKRNSVRLLAAYQEVRILVSRAFSVYEAFLIPTAEVMMILITIFAIVCVLLLQDVVGGFIGGIGVISYVTLVILFRSLAEIQVRSDKMLRQWRRHRTLDRRTWRYLQSCKCAVGSFGFIDTQLVLTATDIIISNALSLLLVIQSK